MLYHEWAPAETAENRRLTAAHRKHKYDGRCAVCRTDTDRIADAVTAAFADLTGQTPSDTED